MLIPMPDGQWVNPESVTAISACFNSHVAFIFFGPSRNHYLEVKFDATGIENDKIREIFLCFVKRIALDVNRLRDYETVPTESSQENKGFRQLDIEIIPFEKGIENIDDICTDEEIP